MSDSFPIVVMISGRGSNLRALVDSARGEAFEIAGVVSDSATAQGIAYAKEVGLKTSVFPREMFADKAAQKRAIYDCVSDFGPKLVVLAGFMQIVEAAFVDRFAGSLINIHPSLLPNFAGLHTHRRAIEAFHASQGQEFHHGCTVHFVDSGVDTGPIIAQASLEISPRDDEATLAARVLELEHKLLPWVVACMARGDIRLSDAASRHVLVSDDAVHEARDHEFILP